MELDESITVAKFNIQDGHCYLLIGWQQNSFEMYLYNKDKLWKGRFSASRLKGLCKNLNMSEDQYYNNMKRCLSQQKKDYRYELKGGFFYWKRKYKDFLTIEGFMPVELDTTPDNAKPDLFEVILVLNKHLKGKVDNLRYKYKSLKRDYFNCLKDTEEFLNLKIEMEKALSDKFLKLLSVKKSQIDEMENKNCKLCSKHEVKRNL